MCYVATSSRTCARAIYIHTYVYIHSHTDTRTHKDTHTSVYIYVYLYIQAHIYIHIQTHTNTYTGGPRYNLQLHSYAPRVHCFRASQKRHACCVRKPPHVDTYFFFDIFPSIVSNIFSPPPPHNDRHVFPSGEILFPPISF